MDELARLKQAGLVRAHGITSHSLAATQAAAGTPWVDSIQARLNTAGIHMDGTFAENSAALAACHQAGQGVIMMKLFGRGAIRRPDERRRSLDAVLRLRSTDVIVVGFDRIAYITDLLDNVEASLKAMELEELRGTP
jgi:aryl-alcohol dehydrogenase-like predicted oxidoreductase